ncbi:protein-tyrosine phosphatase [Acaromyces ingoldii]|uniref:Protein-tyrosine phosphatase n=1 Tax=Acaromyces ingoldii TaxID=215250 RepID=A0A316YVL9_9BASI|nr:protein-tyrosine phosphatase [Acaromyces ingoldii]PWN93487.1 protein-tyrosine phosphatase [Acaromyces ingoldii]
MPSSSSSSSSSSSPSSSTTLTSSALYRSGHPNERNEPFLSTLGLRTIIYLATDQVRPNLSQFASSSGIRLVHVELNVNKEPFAEMDTESVLSALDVILDKRNLPCLVHCNKGKYRVGVVTAIIRRLQGWSLTSIYDEYARFAGGDRVADEEVSLAMEYFRQGRHRERKRETHCEGTACLDKVHRHVPAPSCQTTRPGSCP